MCLNLLSCSLQISLIVLSSFKVDDFDFISKFVLSMNSTTCILDPFPTTALKNCLSVILPHITAIVNTSLSEWIVSHALKMSAVTLVLKKPWSDIAVISNYRPISNLPFLAKVLERVVVSQLQTLYTNSLLEPFQSGFRSGHSTETALVRVLNYLLIIADSGACGLLVLLDLSAAFDTICHSILMNRLHRWISLSETVLSWFKSYLSQRSQFVYLGTNRSQTVPLCQGVPQGSVLGSVLFSVYMLPLGQIIQKYGLGYHCYADDTQIYISTQPDSTTSSLTLSASLLEIKAWMKHHFLKLNGFTTEIVFIGTTSNVNKCSNLKFQLTILKYLLHKCVI